MSLYEGRVPAHSPGGPKRGKPGINARPLRAGEPREPTDDERRARKRRRKAAGKARRAGRR